MGLRGPGAGRLRKAKAKTPEKPLVSRWEKLKKRDDRVIAFLEELPVTKGIRAGETLKLLPNQRAFVRDVYRARKATVRLAIKSEPRGNGKTGLLAGLALAHLLGPEAEQRGEVYSAAIDRQQAGIMFNEMEAIIFARPDMAARVNIQRFHKKIEVQEGRGEGSIYEALSSDARRAHGLSPTLWVYDELAQAKDRVLLDNLITAMGKRSRSLGIIISTQAPNNEHPLSQLIDDAGNDPTIVVKVTSAPTDADPFDRKVIAKCNPALGIFLDRGDVMRNAALARRNPAFEPAHRNLRLNQRVDASAERRLVPPAQWEKGAVPVDLKSLEGRECYGGLDLSGKADLCALELIFPDGPKQQAFDVLSFFWTPEGALEARRPAERDLFKLWIKQGHILAVPGPVIQFEWIARELARLSSIYKIKAIGYDPWRIDEFKMEAADAGCTVPLDPVGQGFKSMAPAIEYLAEKLLSGSVRHGGHPVLTACVANAMLVSDPAGNLKFDKGKSNAGTTTRIDGIVALAMAFSVARRFEEPPEYQMIFV